MIGPKALDYVKRVQKTLPKTPNNKALLMIARAEALIYGGDIDSEPIRISMNKLRRISPSNLDISLTLRLTDICSNSCHLFVYNRTRNVFFVGANTTIIT